MLWILWFTIVFSYYGIFTWLPTLLSEGGRGLTRSFSYVLIITLAQIPGYFSAAYLVEKLGRKWTLVSYLFLTAVGAFFFRNAGAEMDILFWGSFISFFNLGAWGVVYTYTPGDVPDQGEGNRRRLGRCLREIGRCAGASGGGTDAGQLRGWLRVGVPDVRRRTGGGSPQRRPPWGGNQGADAGGDSGLARIGDGIGDGI